MHGMNIKIDAVKVYENSSSGGRGGPCEQTDGQAWRNW